MLTITRLIRFITGLLVAFGLGFKGLAQTAPTWQSAQTMGSPWSFGVVKAGSSAVDGAGNFYEVGNFSGTNATVVGGMTLTAPVGSANSIFIAKYTADGRLAWLRQLNGAGWIESKKVAVDASGHVYVVGFSSNKEIDLGNGVKLAGGTDDRAFIVRYSPEGVAEWAQQATPRSVGHGVGFDAAGNVYFSGFFYSNTTIGGQSISSPGTNTTFLARLSAETGAVQSLVPTFYYTPPASGPGTYVETGLAIGADGRAYLTTSFSLPVTFSSTTTLRPRGTRDGLVACYSPQGRFEWARQFRGQKVAVPGKATPDAAGNVYVAGFVDGAATFDAIVPFGAGNFLAKYSPQGAIQWVRADEGTSTGGWSRVCLDEAGNPYVVGSITGAASFGSVKLISAGKTDIAVASYSPQGDLRWAQSAGSVDSDWGQDISVTGGTVYMIGRFSSTCSFGNQTLSTATLSPTAPSSETFIARLGTSVLATQAARSTTISIYPNPATDQVQLLGLPSGSQVSLVDALGRLARTSVLTAEGKVSVIGLKPGLYSLQATDQQGQTYRSRLVIH
ncbi:T9SS type A sorting domain-containing protein [Hymenobacter sp. GOD-10R]|uniref:T9SS type A sorting domain-containing protein n=1 Tax=Hymenobacter sp. GOD-10R TaxID=3093922 RepID=UPI002D774E3A|nr:T9SS type A sorting domain-containing protein [Hymenobacter sp. GOD-10R]WRQ29162.1 T9SS type A sorting domain-containing protein [Hymenobacter sp. GOD-10R]